MALKKTCKCGTIIDYKDKCCDKCKDTGKVTNKEYDSKIRHSKSNTMYDRFYHSREWLVARAVAIVKTHGLCGDCFDKGIVRAYHTVHHIVPIKRVWDKRLDVSNLVPLCEECHQLRHRDMLQ